MRLFLARFLVVFLLAAFAGPAFARMDDEEEKPRPPKLTPKQILAGIYQPWTGPLQELEKVLRPGRNYLVWIHVPAQHPMDLRSSDMFRRWAYATPVTELTISHNMVAFRCRDGNGRFVTGATGMTGASSLQEVKALLAGHGISVFFATYTDGHLNTQKEVGDYVQKNLRKRGAIFAAFEVSGEQCDSMRGYLSAFVHHPNRPFERYNNVGNPERFEGGGCVTFASALMRKAGLLDTVIPSFFRNFEAARYLMGANLAPIEDMEPPPTPWLQGKRHSVSNQEFWFQRWDIAPAGFPGFVHLRQIDPEKMVYALKQFARVYLEEAPPEARARDERNLALSPLGQRVVTSQGGLRYPINDSFDASMAWTGRLAREWFRRRVRSGDKIHLSGVAGMPVLLLER